MIRGMYTDAIDNITKLNSDPQMKPFVSQLSDKLMLNWAEVEAYKI